MCTPFSTPQLELAPYQCCPPAELLWVYQVLEMPGNVLPSPFSLSELPFHEWGSRPNLIHGSLGPPKSTSQMASRSVQPSLCSSWQWAIPFPPQNCPLNGGSVPHLIHCSLGQPESTSWNGIMTGSAVFQGSRLWQTYRLCYNFRSNRPHLASAMMWPKYNTKYYSIFSLIHIHQLSSASWWTLMTLLFHSQCRVQSHSSVTCNISWIHSDITNSKYLISRLVQCGSRPYPTG